MGSTEADVWSDRFNDKTADVTFISSDGVKFCIHSVLLRAHTGTLAPENASPPETPIALEEDSTALSLLLEFIRPDGDPVVQLKVDFHVLLAVAEAAAKYQVFPALFVCNRELQNVLPDHAVEILVHAYKHSYYELANDAAMDALDTEPFQVVSLAPEKVYRDWFRYRKEWVSIQRKALTEYLPSREDEEGDSTAREIAGKISSLRDLNRTFGGASSLNGWKQSIDRDLSMLPKFTNFIGWPEPQMTERNLFDERQADLLAIIETSEGTEYHIPLDVLNLCTSNFGGSTEHPNRIRVPDSSFTIDILLRFIQPVQTPSLDGLSFLEHKAIALAAEKYSVRQAKGFCRLLMREAVRSHPHDVFHYAAEANYEDILDLTAPLVLGPINSFNDAVKRLPPNLALSWALYYQKWQDAVRLSIGAFSKEGNTIKTRSPSYGGLGGGCYIEGVCTCSNKGNFHQKYIISNLPVLLKEPGALMKLELMLNNSRPCSHAQPAVDRCKSIVKGTISAIHPFSSFVHHNAQDTHKPHKTPKSNGLVEGGIWSDQRANNENTDVTFVSSDGVRFSIKSTFLRAHTEVLAPADGFSLEDPVLLTESAPVLKLLFEFMYPNGEPIVELKVDFGTLSSLAEAAGKYQVYPAIHLCTQELSHVLPEHAVEIFAHAYKHGYRDLLNDSALYAIDADPYDVIDALSEELYKSWLRYREAWTSVQKKALTQYLPSYQSEFSTARRLVEKLSSLNNLGNTFDRAQTNTGWIQQIEADVAAIPKFTALFGWNELETTPVNNTVGMTIESLISIEDSDETEHRIPMDVLCACARNFASVADGKIKVPENSTTMATLLCFIKPVQIPDLNKLQFEELKALAWAAEKYEIRQARAVCRTHMKKVGQEHPHEVFEYAAQTSYVDILDCTAPLVVSPMYAFQAFVERLPARLVSPWILYYQQWQDAVRKLLEALSNQSSSVHYNTGYYTLSGVCSCEANFYRTHVMPVLSTLLGNPGGMRNFESLIAAYPENGQCPDARELFQKCKIIAKDTVNAIPSLSSFL